jgi:hypothetical protein
MDYICCSNPSKFYVPLFKQFGFGPLCDANVFVWTTDLSSSFWGMVFILASTNLLTTRIAAGCFILALFIVLFVADNVSSVLFIYLFILQLLISFVFSTCAYSNHYHLVKCYYLLFELCGGFFAGSALVCINLTWSPSKILFCSMPLIMLLSRIHCIHYYCCLGHTRIYIFPYS